MKNKLNCFIVILMLIFVTFFCGCNDIQNNEKNPLKIELFEIDPNNITKGENATLKWNVENATSISIEPRIGAVSNSGQRIISPINTTTYTLTAVKGNQSMNSSIQIIVQNNPDNNVPQFDLNITAIINTSMGTIKLDLYEQLVPTTVNNFIQYANSGFYEGLVFHRVIDDFVIQGGGYYENGTKKLTNDAIFLEIHNQARHVDGAIAMARTQNPRSATSQFYICDGEQEFLDDEYAVFGVTIEGIDVVRSIASVDTTTKYDMENWPVEDVIIHNISIIELDSE